MLQDTMPKKKKNNTLHQGTICLRDLRHGKYMALPVKKAAGNIFLTGNDFYRVMPNTSWKKITEPKERELLIREFNMKVQSGGVQEA